MNATATTRGATSDSSLLERIARNDEEAFSALYDRYSGLVFSTAKRILHRTGEAEEILHDVFHQVWCTAERFDQSRGSLAGWLLVSARNRAISTLRRKRDRPEDELGENGVSLSVEIESHSAQSLMHDNLRRAMAELPPGQREALELAYFEGMSHNEIAQKTGQPPETINTRLLSAMETLKKVSR